MQCKISIAFDSACLYSVVPSSTMVLAIRNSRISFLVLTVVLLTVTILILDPRWERSSVDDPPSKWSILYGSHSKHAASDKNGNYTSILDESPELANHMASGDDAKGKKKGSKASHPPKEIFEMDERLSDHNITLLDAANTAGDGQKTKSPESSKPDKKKSTTKTSNRKGSPKKGSQKEMGHEEEEMASAPTHEAKSSAKPKGKGTAAEKAGSPNKPFHETPAKQEKVTATSENDDDEAENASSSKLPTNESNSTASADKAEKGKSSWSWDPKRDANNYGLSDEQCDIAFPKLYTDIEIMTARFKGDPITKQDVARSADDTIHALIHEGDLYVIQSPDMHNPYARALASLHAIHRALTAYPDRASLPNIEFVLDIGDGNAPASGPRWGFTKKSDDASFDNVWLAPDYGFYSWPEPKVGAYSEVRKHIAMIEKDLPFEDKEPKLVWRGAPLIEARRNFLALTKDATWADTQAIVWGDKDNLQQSLMTIPDHCRYQFIASIDGYSMSGQGKYMHNCESVFVTHTSTLEYKEIYSWVIETSGPAQNTVSVSEDWSDLEETIEYLLANPTKAKKIAQESKKVFKDRYLTPAAETCYWRKLFRSWRTVTFEPNFYEEDGKTWRGTPFESVALMSAVDWEPH